MLLPLLAAIAIGSSMCDGERTPPIKIAKILFFFGLGLTLFFTCIFLVSERLTYHDAFIRTAISMGYSSVKAEAACFRDILCTITLPASAIPLTPSKFVQEILPIAPFVIPFFFFGGIFALCALIEWIESRLNPRQLE